MEKEELFISEKLKICNGREMKISPRLLRYALNIYPPYLGAGVKVDYIARDWREIRVSMKLRWYNRNAVGTHFGGSLYSMVDPHLMLMLIQLLGRDYIVWDKSATIDFVRPGRGRVFSRLIIAEQDTATICKQLESENKVLPEFNIAVLDENNKAVAKVKKILYVRRK